MTTPDDKYRAIERSIDPDGSKLDAALDRMIERNTFDPLLGMTPDEWDAYLATRGPQVVRVPEIWCAVGCED